MTPRMGTRVAGRASALLDAGHRSRRGAVEETAQARVMRIDRTTPG